MAPPRVDAPQVQPPAAAQHLDGPPHGDGFPAAVGQRLPAAAAAAQRTDPAQARQRQDTGATGREGRGQDDEQPGAARNAAAAAIEHRGRGCRPPGGEEQQQPGGRGNLEFKAGGSAR